MRTTRPIVRARNLCPGLYLRPTRYTSMFWWRVGWQVSPRAVVDIADRLRDRGAKFRLRAAAPTLLGSRPIRLPVRRSFRKSSRPAWGSTRPFICSRDVGCLDGQSLLGRLTYVVNFSQLLFSRQSSRTLIYGLHHTVWPHDKDPYARILESPKAVPEPVPSELSISPHTT